MNNIIITIFNLILLTALLTLSLIFCTGCSNSNEPEETKSNFSIYLLEDENLKYKDIKNKDLSTLKLQKSPIITEEDLEYYDFGNHIMYLKKDLNTHFKEYGTIFNSEKWGDRPFLVMADGSVRYAGFFMGDYSYSNENEIPYINFRHTFIKKYLRILQFMLIEYKDVRNDTIVKNALLRSNKIKGSIEYVLDSIKIYNADTTSIEYTIIIKNISSENIYFYDPDKVSIKNYIYYSPGSLGLQLIKKGSRYGCYNHYFQAICPSSVDSSFTRLEPNRSVRRTLLIKGYNRISNGIYYCQTAHISPEILWEYCWRDFGDGKSIIGIYRSNIIEIEYNGNNNCIIKNRNAVVQ